MGTLKEVQIRSQDWNNLSVTQDTDENDDVCATLTFSPTLKRFEHFHIELNVEESKKLRDWLNEFLETYATSS